MIRIDRNGQTSVGYSSMSEELLPYPYESNCFEYQKSLGRGIFYSSREDCIVKHYQRKEFEKCGCNRKWIYYNKQNSTGVKFCSKSSKCNFEYEFDESLAVMCRKNCFNKYYNTYEDGKSRLKDGYQYIIFLKHGNDEISITHSARMNLNDYFSSIGGLMSMWFGIDIYNTFLFVFKILSNSIAHYLNFNFYLQNIFDWIIIRIMRLKKYLRYLLIITCTIQLSLQISILFKSYLEYDTITRFEMNDKKYYPEFFLELIPTIQNLTKLKNFYPKYKRKIDRDLAKHGYNVFSEQILREIALDNNFDKLNGIFGTDKFIKSCQLIRGKQSFNCSNSKIGIRMNAPTNDLIYYPLLHNKTVSFIKHKECHREKFHKIKLILMDLGLIQIEIKDCELEDLKGYQHLIEEKLTTRLSFSTYSVKKISNSHNKCVNDADQPYYSEYFSGSCINDCFLFHSNRTFGCLPFNYKLIYMVFEFHMTHMGYKFCNHSINSTELLNNIDKFCETFCLPKCETIYIEVKVEKTSNEAKETIIEIFPLKSRHLEYVETLKTDFNQLIYNCGGIMGLWFGLSLMSVSDLFNIVNSIGLTLERFVRKVIIILPLIREVWNS
jgi:hypothetical protein